MGRKVGTAFSKQVWIRIAQAYFMAALIVGLVSGCSATESSQSKDAAASTTAPMAPSKQKLSSEVVSESLANTAAAPQEQAEDKQSDSFNGGTGSFGAAMDRKIIYKANVTMQVDHYAETQAKIESVVIQAGGYILQFNENETLHEKNGMFVIKVPANGFQSLLKQLEAIHPSLMKNMQGQDVSEEFVDLSSRLKAKQLVEGRLIEFMEKAAKTDELLSFSNELGKVQEEIERLKGRMRFLEQNVSYSTVEIRLSQKLGSAAVIQANGQGPLLQRAAAALNDSVVVLIMVFKWLIVAVAAVLPVVFVCALLGLPVYWILHLRKNKKNK